MSNYKNYVSDFPKRCSELLELCTEKAELEKREVTLMLCIASTSIIIPVERLKEPKIEKDKKTPGHFLKDWERYKQAKDDYEKLLDGRFRGSPLWPDADPKSWCFDELADVTSDPDAWPELRVPKRLNNIGARKVVYHIRNALAHGNIFTRGRDKIEEIILLSKPCQSVEKFEYLLVAPTDFQIFLKYWLKFLQSLHLPVDVFENAAA